MARRNLGQISLDDYLLGVYPVSMRCQRQYKAKFHLYFQKNMQIISRYQSPNQQIRKEEVVLFNDPQKLYPFRVQLDKIADYKWSVYMKRVDKSGSNEEFLDRCSVNLKNDWEHFKQFRDNRSKKIVQFPKIKIKFNFVIIFATSPHQLGQFAHTYFGKPVLEEKIQSSKIKNPHYCLIPQSERQKKMQQKERKKQDKNDKKQQKQAREVEDRKQQQKQQRISEVKRYSSQQGERQLTIKLPKNTPMIPQAVSSEEQSPTRSRNSLTNSQRMFGQEIKDKIKLLALEQQQQKNEELMKEAQSQILTKEQSEQSREESHIKITSSKLLDSTGKPVIPLYKKKNFIIIVVTILITFVSLFFVVTSVKKKRNKRQKVSEAKKQSRRQRKKQGKYDL